MNARIIVLPDFPDMNSSRPSASLCAPATGRHRLRVFLNLHRDFLGRLPMRNLRLRVSSLAHDLQVHGLPGAPSGQCRTWPRPGSDSHPPSSGRRPPAIPAFSALLPVSTESTSSMPAAFRDAEKPGAGSSVLMRMTSIRHIPCMWSIQALGFRARPRQGIDSCQTRAPIGTQSR